MGLVSPAQPLKEDMVALGAKFDPSEQTHWGVPPLCFFEHDRVEVLHRDPPEDRPRLKKEKIMSHTQTLQNLLCLFHIRLALAH